MSVVSHTTEAVEQCERVDRYGHVPAIIVIFAHSGGEGEHRRYVARDKRLPAMEERGVAARLARPQAAKPRLNPNVNEGCYSGPLASGKRVFSCPIIIDPKAVAVQQRRGSADRAVADVLQRSALLLFIPPR